MKIRILGPLEILDGERWIEINAPKQRLLLTVLALAGGHVVSADRLMDELWRSEPPSGGVKTLHYHVSKLRDVLQPDRAPGEEGIIVTRPPGYALIVGADDIDARLFERTVGDARRLLEFDPAQAAARLREALDTWRGPMPIELLEAPSAGLEARRLEELRLTALEDRIDADLAAGRHAEVVPELEALTAEHSLRERLWAQLMVALYRSDRQAEALRAYQALRSHLGDEIGIEPSPDLCRLEESILLQDPDLDVPEALQRPASLRGYDLQERIGEGAFGLVWRAAQVSVDREVAIKVVRPEHSNRPGSVLGFQAQARLLATLEHPHIVPVFDFWRDPDGAYLVMPLMTGGSLETHDTSTWETSRVVDVIDQVTTGLAHAHDLGLVHADLHPGNVLFDAQENAYLSDFGLAANLSGGTNTPPEAFSSPEQSRGEPPSPASDVYGLGRLTYRLFSGTDPAPGALPKLQSARSGVKASVDTVLRRATDPDAAKRHPNAGAFRDDLHRALGDLPVVVAEPRNPFKGLRPFGEADAPDFFGRDDLIEDLAEAVANRRLVGVVGPSGSGKSSLVRAGLIPALRSGRLPGSDGWLIADVYPGVDPFTALGEALRSVAVESVPDLADPGIDPKQFAAAVRSGLPPDAELVLIVDQFEELFTLCGDEHTRRRFMDVLLALTDDPDVGARVILTLRADYYGLLLQYRPMGEALRAAVVAITPLGSEQLRRAITGPAEAVGLEVEPELVADLAGDVAAEPGGLPLMEYALTRLFKERSGARLDVATYREMGGLSEALAGWPERLYGDLDESDREAARQLFLRLVSVDEAGQDSRRRVGLPELYGLGIDTAVVDRVIGGFVEARLVTFDSDPITRTPTVEVAHEALLERWGRLRDWIEVHRESLMLYRRFGGAHADWEHADRDPDYLLRGGRLRLFEAWSREAGLVLTEPEREYLLASRDRENAAMTIRRRRRNLIAAALGVLGAAVIVFGVFALIQRDRAGDQQAVAEEQAANAEEQAARAEGEAANAEEQAALAVQSQSRAEEQASIADEERGRAEEQERIARARSLAASAAANLEKDPELAVLLALEAVEMTRQSDGMVLREAEEALHAAVTANRLVSTVAVEQWARTVAYAPDGDHFYVGGRTSGQIVEALSGSIEGDIKVDIGAGPSVSNIAVMAIAGADDELLVVAHYGPGRISVLDARTLEKVFTLEGGSVWVTDLGVSADGVILAGIDPYDGMVFIWDLEEQSRIAEFELDCELGCSRGVALSRDGTVVTAGNTVWNVVTGEPLLAIDGPADDVEMIDERRMIRGDGILVHVVDIVTKETLQTLRGHSAGVTSIDVTADGRMAATGSQDGLVLLWDLDSLESSPVMTLPAQRGTVWEVKFAPDGRYLTSVAGRQQLDADLVDTWPTDWEARTWDISAAGSREWMGCATRDGHVAFGPTGDLVVVADPDTGAGIWDVASGTKTVVLGGRAGGSEVTATAFAPDGFEIVLGGIMPSQEGETGTLGWVAVFAPTTGEMIRELVPPTPEVVPKDLAYSDDGSRLGLVGTGLALVWDTTSWNVSTNLSDLSEATAYTAIAFHPDKRYLTTQFNAYSDWGFPSGHLWDLDGGKVQYEYGHSPRAGRGDVAVSPNGRLLVTAGVGRPAVTEPFTGRELARLEGAPSHAASVAFSPNGTRIATGEADGTVRLWDAATGEQSLVLTGHTAMVVDVAFSPDGSRLASVGLDGAMRVWALYLDDLLVIARSGVERQLTDVECRTFVGEGCAPAPGLERLIPAIAGWEGPYGIDATAWEAAGAGGEWVEGPPGIAGTLAFDPSSRRMVVFEDYVGTWLRGREAEVWEAGAPMPPAPESWSAVGSVGQVVYHGGLGMVVTTRIDDGTTFGYDTRADSWSELHSPVDALIGRYGYGIAYDEESDLIVLFGGAEWGRTDQGKHVGFGDTWVFDSAAGTWTDVTPDISPPPRIQPVMVYDTQSDRIVLFGGHTKVSGDVLGDTWVYDTNTNSWRESQSQVTPPARSDSAAWYDSEADITFAFGGSADLSSYPPLPWMALGGEELWGYDLETDTWTLFRVDPNPGYSVSVYLVAVFDAESGEAILNGTDGFDEDRRFQGWRERMWTYRHDGG